MNPLNSIKGVWIAGIILAIILAVIANLATAGGWFSFEWLPFWRWVHIIAGVTWVGLLYYFNFVQVPAVAEAGNEAAPINKYVAPKALLWFRWSALATWVAGAIYLYMNEQFVNAFTLGLTTETVNQYGLWMGIGAWLGTIMLINVWALIWPNQKKVLGMVDASDDEKASAKKIAKLASRSNVVMSIPMLMFMVSAGHGLAL